MEVVMTTGAIRRAKPQSSVITTNKPTPSFFIDWMPSCRPTNSVGAFINQILQSTEFDSGPFDGRKSMFI